MKHVLTILAVPELAEAVAFYDAAVGWPHAVDTPVYVEMQHPDGQRIGLYQRDSFAKNTGVVPEPPPDGTTATELYFHCDDVDATANCLAAAGAQLLSDAAPRPWGEVVAYFRGPCGNVLAVASK